MRAEDLTWLEYQQAITDRIVVLPIGAIDGHGPHLPLSTDTIVAQHLARILDEHLGALILPAIAYGLKTEPSASGGDFPAANLRAATFTNVVLDVLCASYRHGARRFLILDSHKANAGANREAFDLFIDRAPDVRVMAAAWWDLVSEASRNTIAAETGVSRQDDHHAAMVETSLVMHIAPNLVRRNLLADDSVPRQARYLIRPVPQDLRTQTGVVYRAGMASPAIGQRLLTEIESNLVDAVRRELW